MAKGKHSSGEREPAKGDKVAWRSHRTETSGTVEKKITERTEAAGRTVAASPDDPQYEVRSDKSGRTAVHKPSALKRKKSQG
ncbi:DUF2945 domain-containing protein [Streptomyces rameus]|uniref:DUF2945 domain-containing protein n=1 Tax=Streptomyces rameus TaxID=68261 RepID=A0ABP6NAS1_9ACTN